MISELYKEYKQEYNEYVILIKSGNFYLSLNKDSFVMHNIFNYQIKEIKNGYKVGFPIQSLEKVKNKLEIEHVNYIVIEDSKLIHKYGTEPNIYKKYVIKKNYSIILSRIEKINDILKKNIDNNIESILTEIEGLLCMID